MDPDNPVMQAFLSHSSADRPLAATIYRSLRDQAVSVWFDRMEMAPGDSLLKKIADGISNSDCVLVLVTENSKRSTWVEKEVSIALTGAGPRLIPLLLRGCEMPSVLADKIYITVELNGNGIQDIVIGARWFEPIRRKCSLDVAIGGEGFTRSITGFSAFELIYVLADQLASNPVGMTKANLSTKEGP